jgi:hypothetical protein
MTRSLRPLSLLVTSSVLLAATLATVATVTTSNAAAADPLPEISASLERIVTEGAPGHSQRVILGFCRSGDRSEASSVKLTLVDGTATRGSDYTAAAYSKILRFPANTSFVYLNLNVRGDAIVEPDETFSWHLSDPTGATIRVGNADGSVVILDDDSAEPPTLSVEDASSYESESIPTHATFIVRRSGSTAATARVTITTFNGTARAPGDYAARRSTLYFGVGHDFAWLHVPIKEDLVPEPEETFSARISNPVRATIVDYTAVATIRDDDSSAPPELVAQDGFACERYTWLTASITIERRGDRRGTSTVTYTTSDGTAHAPEDYTAKTGRITFRPGDTYKTINVTLKDDRIPEPREDFFITLSDPSAGTTISDPVSRVQFCLDYD